MNEIGLLSRPHKAPSYEIRFIGARSDDKHMNHVEEGQYVVDYNPSTTKYQVTQNCNHTFDVHTQSIEISADDFIFLKSELEELLPRLNNAHQNNQKSTSNALSECGKENLTVISILLDFIFNKSTVRAAQDPNQAAKLVSTQNTLIAALETKFENKKYISQSTLTKKFGPANKVLSEGKYPEKNNENEDLPIIQALRDLILASKTKIKNDESVSITKQDQLIKYLATNYKNRSHFSEEILKKKFSNSDL